MDKYIRCFFYGLLLVFSAFAFTKSGLSNTGLTDDDWKNLFFSVISLIFAIILFDGSLYIHDLQKKKKTKKRITKIIKPIFRNMHELWFLMSFHSSKGIMGGNNNLFSEEYKIEICKYLNLEGQAPVTGNVTWREFLFSKFDSFEKELKEVHVLLFSIGWEEAEENVGNYLSSGFNLNIKTYLYSPFSLPGGLNEHPYLSVLGHWGKMCLDDYLTFIVKVNSLVNDKKYDFYQFERIKRIKSANEFGKSRLSNSPVKNL